MKCTDRPFRITEEYEKNLLKKCEVYKNIAGKKQAMRLVMISASGIEGVAHTEHISDVITLEAVVT